VQLARHLIGGFGALAIALLADEKKQPDGCTLLAQALGGSDLRGDDALGIAGAASVDVVLIFRGGEPGRDDIHVSRENELRIAHARGHGKNIGALAFDRKFARVVTERAEMAMEEIADGSFVVGDGFDVDESASEGEEIHGVRISGYRVIGQSGNRGDWLIGGRPFGARACDIFYWTPKPGWNRAKALPLDSPAAAGSLGVTDNLFCKPESK